jgi:hypothetical protein
MALFVGMESFLLLRSALKGFCHFEVLSQRGQLTLGHLAGHAIASPDLVFKVLNVCLMVLRAPPAAYLMTGSGER